MNSSSLAKQFAGIINKLKSTPEDTSSATTHYYLDTPIPPISSHRIMDMDQQEDAEQHRHLSRPFQMGLAEAADDCIHELRKHTHTRITLATLIGCTFRAHFEMPFLMYKTWFERISQDAHQPDTPTALRVEDIIRDLIRRRDSYRKTTASAATTTPTTPKPHVAAAAAHPDKTPSLSCHGDGHHTNPCAETEPAASVDVPATPTVIYECPICQETDRPTIMLYTCGHVACQECVEQWANTCAAENHTCPICRKVQTEAPRVHEPHQQLRDLCHCRKCFARFDETVMPVLLLPCLHHLCRICFDDLEGCAQCSVTVNNAVEDHLFLHHVVQMHPPPTAPVPSPRPQYTLQRFTNWLRSVQREIYIATWPGEQAAWNNCHKLLWNELMRWAIELATMIGEAFEEETIRELICSFGLPTRLRDDVTNTIQTALQTLRARNTFQISGILPIASVPWMTVA